MGIKHERHHYVPQMYLKRFTEDVYYLFEFDKLSQKSRWRHVRRAACEEHYYTLSSERVEGRDSEVEQWLSEVESKSGQALKEVVEEIGDASDCNGRHTLQTLGVKSEARSCLAGFIALQILRTQTLGVYT